MARWSNFSGCRVPFSWIELGCTYTEASDCLIFQPCCHHSSCISEIILKHPLETLSSLFSRSCNRNNMLPPFLQDGILGTLLIVHRRVTASSSGVSYAWLACDADSCSTTNTSFTLCVTIGSGTGCYLSRQDQWSPSCCPVKSRHQVQRHELCMVGPRQQLVLCDHRVVHLARGVSRVGQD
jgi:hypothetical protein